MLKKKEIHKYPLTKDMTQYVEISKNMCKFKTNTSGACLVVAGGLMQDLTLILSTKKHQNKQNKQRKQSPSKNSSTTKEVERDSL